MIESNKTFGISEKSFKKIIDTLTKFPEIRKAIIFGSRALGNAKAGSDIDIALEGEKITDEIVRKVKVILNERENIPYFVDVVNLNTIKNDELREHINKFGKDFFVRKVAKSIK